MTKQNLTEYGEGELSLVVFNDEGLYNMRHETGFEGILDDFFEYTYEQMEVLKADLNDELEEDND